MVASADAVELERFGLYAGFQPGSDATTLIITFAHRDVPAGHFSLVTSLRTLPAAKLFLNCVHGTWYTEGIPPFGDTVEETVAGLRRFAAERGVERIVTIGSSMGAYGALLYGLALEARAVLAFSPEIVLGLPHSRSIRHLKGKPATPCHSLIEAIRHGAERVHLFCGDGEPVDLLQAAMVAELTPLRPWVVRRCGHTSLRSVHSAGRFKAVIAAALDGDATPALEGIANRLAPAGILDARGGTLPQKGADLFPLYRRLVESRGEPAMLWHQIGRLFLKTDPAYALHCQTEALKRAPDQWRYLVSAGEALMVLKRPAEAEALLRRGMESGGDGNARVMTQLAASLMAQGRWGGKRREARRLLELIPRDQQGINSPDMVALSRQLAELGNKALALDWARAALARNPSNDQAQANLRELEKRRFWP